MQKWSKTETYLKLHDNNLVSCNSFKPIKYDWSMNRRHTLDIRCMKWKWKLITTTILSHYFFVHITLRIYRAKYLPDWYTVVLKTEHFKTTLSTFISSSSIPSIRNKFLNVVNASGFEPGMQEIQILKRTNNGNKLQTTTCAAIHTTWIRTTHVDDAHQDAIQSFNSLQ